MSVPSDFGEVANKRGADSARESGLLPQETSQRSSHLCVVLQVDISQLLWAKKVSPGTKVHTKNIISCGEPVDILPSHSLQELTGVITPMLHLDWTLMEKFTSLHSCDIFFLDLHPLRLRQVHWQLSHLICKFNKPHSSVPSESSFLRLLGNYTEKRTFLASHCCE